ncbi:MAG: PEPxxWA-CTERM sorting domain-containing protein [Sandarakinorhabdus sp.]|nr:PEPxxWA-CTERM sorting domain-containing protein [Sandarakinorhabdus sp.]
MPLGNGVNAGIFDGANPLYASGALAGPGLAFGTQASFAAQPAIHLNASDTLSFVVNNNGDYSYDSTGLLGTITGTSGTAQYDAFRAFGSGNPSAAVWTYGTGAGATQFSAFPVGYGNCFGSATFQCQTNVGPNVYVAVGRTTALADQTIFGTATLPTDALFLHPDNGLGATDAVVRFTTPVNGKYTVAGLFERLSDAAHPFGNGVNVEVYNGGTLLFSSSTLAAPNPLSGYPTDQVSFNSIGLLTLNSGDVLSFVVNNNGEYSYDSTGLKAVVTYVPEPATWMTMIVGFGLIGAAARRRVARTA